jgi:hypothetical protein
MMIARLLLLQPLAFAFVVVTFVVVEVQVAVGHLHLLVLLAVAFVDFEVLTDDDSSLYQLRLIDQTLMVDLLPIHVHIHT